MPPLVYAIVLNHDGEAWLTRCLETLLSSSYSNLRVVLLDNGSTDGSASLVRTRFPGVEIVETGANLGFSGGNNAGIRHALYRGADYVVLLNNDTYFERDWLLRLVEAGEASPKIGVLGPVQLVFDGEEFNTWTTSAFPHLLEKLRRQDDPGVWFPVEWVEGSCFAVKRRLFEQLGLLDPIFFAFFEEFDFCRRARAAGFEVALVPSSKIHHHRGGFYGQPRLARRRAFFVIQSSMIYNSSDPTVSLSGNVKRLLRNDATHLKEALFGRGSLVVWCKANCAMFGRLPALYRKWHADRNTLQHVRAALQRDLS